MDITMASMTGLNVPDQAVDLLGYVHDLGGLENDVISGM